jgi:hypothetical protein
MRFNNRFCALMDVPDLPIGAFEHIGDSKIKPQGGGNPISAITDPISSALGTDGGGGGVLGAVEGIGKGIGDLGESIDKGITQPIGRGLADLDKFVGREIPGGWTTVGLAAAAVAAPYAAPYLTSTTAGTTSAAGLAGGGAFVPAAGSGAVFTLPAVEAGVAAATSAGIASEVGQAAFFDALATGATGSEAISAGLAAESLVAPAASSALTTEQILGSTGFVPAEGSGASFAIDPTAAYTTASSGAPVYDFSEPVDITPGGNTVPAGTSPQDMAAYDLTQKSVGEEALKKYGGMSTSQKAMMGIMAARGLLAQQPRPQQMPQMQVGRAVTNPSGAVDYSGLLNLLSPRTPSRSNPYSLLG